MSLGQYPPPCFALFDTRVVQSEPGHTVLRFMASQEHENPYGFVQGGLLVAMLDNCFGSALVALCPEHQTATIELKVNYLSAVRSGEAIIGEARVIKKGRSTAYLEASLSSEDGTLLCRASCTNLIKAPVAG